MQNLLNQTSSGWVRYSDYEWKPGKNGMMYLTPTENAQPESFDPMKCPEEIIMDVLKVGNICDGTTESVVNQEGHGVPPVQIKMEAIRSFVCRYGLLGLMTEMPNATRFLEMQDDVYFSGDKPIKTGKMNRKDYVMTFFPFSDRVEMNYTEDTDEKKDVYDYIVAGITKKPYEEEICYQRGYSEPYEWMEQKFRDLFYAALACSGHRYMKVKGKVDEDVLEAYNKLYLLFFRDYVPCGKIVLRDRPVFVWEFYSPLTAIQLMIGLMLTDEQNPIKLCPKCRLPFIESFPEELCCSQECAKALENAE